MKKKTFLMVDDHMLNKVLDNIKEIISIEKFDDTKILIDADDVTLKKFVILMTCIIKDGNKFYPQLFLDHAF